MFDFKTFFKILEKDNFSSISNILKKAGGYISPLIIPVNKNDFIFRIYINKEYYYLKVTTSGHQNIEPLYFTVGPTYCTTEISVINHPHYYIYNDGVEAWNAILTTIEDCHGLSIIELSNGIINYQDPISNP